MPGAESQGTAAVIFFVFVARCGKWVDNTCESLLYIGCLVRDSTLGYIPHINGTSVHQTLCIKRLISNNNGQKQGITPNI